MEPTKYRVSGAPGEDQNAFGVRFIIILVLGLVGAWIGSALAEAPTKWAVYLIGTAVLGAIWLTVSDKRTFLFGMFLMALQANVSYRLYHGYAGGTGIVLPLPFVAGVALVFYEIAVGRLRTADLSFATQASRPIALYVVMSLLSAIFSTEHFVSFIELVRLAEYLFLYYLAINLIKTRDDLRFVISGLLLTLLIQCVIYVIQSSLGLTFTLTGEVYGAGSRIPRPGGTVDNNPNGFASYIIIPLMMVVAFYVRNVFLKPSRAAILSGLGTFAIIITYTRAAWGAAVLGFATILWLSVRRGGTSPRRAFILIGFAVAGTVAALPLILARFEGAPLNESYDERWQLMLMAMRVIEAHPVFGVGPGAYGDVFKGIIGSSFHGVWVYSVHNVYLLKAAELGIVGGIAWVWILVNGIRSALVVSRSKNPEFVALGLGITGALVGLAFEMYWDIWNGFTYNALFWFTLGLTEVMLRLDAAVEPDTGNSESTDAPAAKIISPR